MTSLVLRSPCEHGVVPSDDFPHYECGGTHVTSKHFDEGLCPGGSEVVLDPTTVLRPIYTIGSAIVPWRYATVADVVAALQGDF